MTHVGKECRFESVRFFGFFLGLNQFQFHLFAGSDVGSQFHDCPTPVKPFYSHTLDGVPTFGDRIVVFPKMNACKLTVGIKQLWLRAVFTPIFQSCIQHSPTFCIFRNFSCFFPERLIGKNHFQCIVIAHKNISIDIIQYLLHGSLRLLQRYFNLPAFGSSGYNLRYLAHQFHILFIPLFVPAKVK